ncbi:SEL1-like repeat protein [uncultured Actinobacillus sp.]|nr:SEL1-like repeat protein [uncultured Actinobacillus sp.]
MYYNGQGVRQDKSKAKYYWGLACDNGDQMGCDNYRKLSEQGY